MAKIFYSVSGEGRGHASRAAAIIDSSRHQHNFTLFASGQAYDYLAPRYAGVHSGVRIYPIKGLRFHYYRGRLAVLNSITKGVQFWAKAAAQVDHLSRIMGRHNPDLVVTDFEPLLPRAAERMNIPYVSFDHQHFLTNYDLSALPFGLRVWAWLMKFAVKAHYHRQSTTIVTSFYQLPTRPKYANTVSVGPIVRQAIEQVTPSNQGYLLSYFRKHTSERVLKVMSSAPCEVRVYGLGERPPMGGLRFFDFDQHKFVEDLAGCMGVVGAAGNQTLGEALYLGKPVLALPEENHFEQRINAFYLQHLSYGLTTTLNSFREHHLKTFIDSLGEYSHHVGDVLRTGNAAALATIENHLNHVERPRVKLVA